MEEIKAFNDDLLVAEFAAELLLFAGDGANELYAFDRRTTKLLVVKVPMIVMLYEDTKFCADTFTEFLERLSQLQAA